ncbi:spike base protein, RCAP_Rcc01079 family [Paracoccus simplex]|uniref:Uncharacterized protein n=1 Tax=Paracoccus simplex TaxID=2086346 RepID=A0ABV7S0N2_9RHOB
MPGNRFSPYSLGANASAIGSYAITPSDGDDLPEVIRAVTLGASGTLAWRGLDGQTYETAALPAGTYAVSADRILATGTTATDITGWV